MSAITKGREPVKARPTLDAELRVKMPSDVVDILTRIARHRGLTLSGLVRSELIAFAREHRDEAEDVQ
jgi:hypothetical protein